VGSLEGRVVIELENASLLTPSSFPIKNVSFEEDSPIGHECDNFSLDVIKLRSKVLSSIKVVVLSTKINLLLPFGPMAILVDKMYDSHVSFFIHLNILLNIDSIVNHVTFDFFKCVSGLGLSLQLIRHYTLGRAFGLYNGVSYRKVHLLDDLWKLKFI
jgi:hypothetical protein